jgi:hypothetical protein
MKTLGAPGAAPKGAPEQLTSGPPQSTGPTGQSHWGRGGADRADLAAGELPGGEVTTDELPTTACIDGARWLG